MLQRRSFLKSGVLTSVAAAVGLEQQPASAFQAESSEICRAGVWQPTRCFCVPPDPNGKHKDDIERKFLRLAEANVPMVFPAAVYQMSRRFLAGASPQGELEAAVFPAFAMLSAGARDLLACAVENIDSLPPDLRDRVFAKDVTSDTIKPVLAEELGPLFDREVEQRAHLDVFGSLDCLDQERPGRIRLVLFSDDVTPDGYYPSICRLNGRRTGPRLTLLDVDKADMQQVCDPECHPSVEDCQDVEQNCTVQQDRQPDPCPGYAVEEYCLNVPEVEPGDTLVLDGFNFHSTRARVLLRPRGSTAPEREVDGIVCGDLETPQRETVGGELVTIADCRVHDRIAFAVPGDITPGLYEILVSIPNEVGPFVNGAVQVDTYTSAGDQSKPVIFVKPPAIGEYSIATEQLRCFDESNPEWAGSDEIRVIAYVVPLSLDGDALIPGELLEPFGTLGEPFNELDDDSVREFDSIVFQARDTAGVIIALVGFEIDSWDAFKEQAESFGAAWELAYKTTWGKTIRKMLDGAGAAAGCAVGYYYAGQAGCTIGSAIGAAIGEILTAGVFALYAAWAPADLIIEDSIALTASDLFRLTAKEFPAPAATQYTTRAGGIRVDIDPKEKAFDYRETRQYRSDDSGYEIVFRYGAASP